MGIGLAHARQDLELLMLLSLGPECLDCRHVLPHPPQKVPRPLFLIIPCHTAPTAELPRDHSVCGAPEGFWKMLPSARYTQLSGTHTVRVRLLRV